MGSLRRAYTRTIVLRERRLRRFPTDGGATAARTRFVEVFFSMTAPNRTVSGPLRGLYVLEEKR